MNLSQLYYFQHLAEVQHYTRAAENLYITQPALSHAISSLEDELGCNLFQKDGRNMRLTEDGMLFKKYVDEGLNAIDNGVSELKSRHGMLSGTIQIGAIATARSGYLPQAMKEYRDIYGPLIDYTVYQGETATLTNHLENGMYDMIICGPCTTSGITCKTLFYQELALVVPKDHPWASKEKISFSEMVGQRINTYRDSITLGRIVTDFMKKCGAPIEEMGLVRNYDDEVILGAISTHEKVPALSLVTSNLMIDNRMVIIPLDEEGADEVYPISLSYRTKAFRSVAAQRFIDFLESFEAEQYVHPLRRQ